MTLRERARRICAGAPTSDQRCSIRFGKPPVLPGANTRPTDRDPGPDSTHRIARHLPLADIKDRPAVRLEAGRTQEAQNRRGLTAVDEARRVQLVVNAGDEMGKAVCLSAVIIDTTRARVQSNAMVSSEKVDVSWTAFSQACSR